MNPNQQLTTRALPNCRPELAVKEYMISKAGESLPKRKPEWDDARRSPAMQLVIARRELVEAERRLAEKRVAQVIKRKEMDKQWDLLTEKEATLRESFHHFHKFVKENLEKRERAKLKMSEEQELQSKCNAEIRELSASVKHLSKIKDSFEGHLATHKIYEDYLEKVVKASTELESIQDILNRYETLTAARINLTDTQEKKLNEMEEARNEMLQLTKEKSAVIVTLNSQMAQLQSRHSVAHSQATRWETAVDKIKDAAVEKKNEITQVKNSCWHLYQQICKRKGFPATIDPLDHENQLLFIKRNIVVLRKVVRLARQRSNRESRSTEAQDSKEPASRE